MSMMVSKVSFQEKFSIKRKDFATLQSTDISYFTSILSEDRVVTDESEILPFNIDWFNQCRGTNENGDAHVPKLISGS